MGAPSVGKVDTVLGVDRDGSGILLDCLIVIFGRKCLVPEPAE